jgi:hypothetical protein
VSTTVFARPTPPYEGGEELVADAVDARAAADDDSPPEEEAQREARSARLAKMHATAGQFDIVHPSDDEAQRFELRREALFRYSDQPRGFVDAVLWAWEQPGGGGRPVAVAKVEMALRDKVPIWQFCVASLADHPLHVDFAGERKLTAIKAGVEFQRIPGAGKPPERPALWSLHARDLAARFGATIHARHLDTKEVVQQEMRVLPTPIHTYSDVKPVSLAGRSSARRPTAPIRIFCS